MSFIRCYLLRGELDNRRRSAMPKKLGLEITENLKDLLSLRGEIPYPLLPENF